MKPINVGLIGCGRVARLHMNVYKRMENVNVVALSDINIDKAKALANEYGINPIFEDYGDLLEIRDLDFVDVCTPTSTHASIVCDAANSGNNVLVEKPMALSSDECERMISESERNGVKLCVCHNQRFFSSILQAKSMVESGYYNVLSFRITWRVPESLRKSLPTWQLTPEEGGILWEGGYHPAYIQLYFLENIEEIYAVGGKLLYPIYDNFTVVLRTRKPSYGVIEYSLISKEGEKLCEILSSDGKRAEIDLQRDSLVDESGKPSERRGLYGPHDTVSRTLTNRMKYAFRRILRPTSKLQRAPSTLYFLTHLRLISAYIDSLQKDSSPPVSPTEGKNTVKLLEAIKTSLDENQPILVK